MKYFKYFRYLFKHKWYVMLECFKRKLFWRGLVHDNSKFLPREFIPYANHFYGNNGSINRGRDENGYYKPYDTGDKAFDFAWLIHQKVNRHHWQWWILPKDDGDIKILEIEYPYNVEMICDWIGAGKAQGNFSPKNNPYGRVRKWYVANRKKMQLHPSTASFIERFIGIEDEDFIAIS